MVLIWDFSYGCLVFISFKFNLIVIFCCTSLKHVTYCLTVFLSYCLSVLLSRLPSFNQLLGSGPLGDNDLWYHYMPGTFCSVCFSVSLSVPPQSSQLALPGGSRPPSWLQRASRALSAGFRALSAGSRGLSAGIRALPAGPETLFADSRPSWPSRWLRASQLASKGLPADFRAFVSWH